MDTRIAETDPERRRLAIKLRIFLAGGLCFDAVRDAALAHMACEPVNGAIALLEGCTGKYARNDLRGMHVTYRDTDGRVWLGEVVEQAYRQHGAAGTYLRVRHLNGEPWPFGWLTPAAVMVLPRTYEHPDATSETVPYCGEED